MGQVDDVAVDENLLGDGLALRQTLEHPLALTTELAAIHAQIGLYQPLVEQRTLCNVVINQT
ncbi:hypothetical protein GCM10027514_18990 [Azotobacter armeniacus]